MPGIFQTLTSRPLPIVLSHLLNRCQSFWFFFSNYKLMTCFQILASSSAYLNPCKIPWVYLEVSRKLAFKYSFVLFKTLHKKGRWGLGTERSFGFHPLSTTSIPRSSLLLHSLGSCGTEAFRIVIRNLSTMKCRGCHVQIDSVEHP